MSLRITKWSCVAFLFFLAGSSSTTRASEGSVSIARSSGSEFIRLALASGNKDIFIPTGIYRIGPEPILIPEGVTIRGSGRETVFEAVKGTRTAFQLSKHSRLSSFALEGKEIDPGGIQDGVVLLPQSANGSVIDNVSFIDCDRASIVTDHASDLLVKDCKFENVGMAVSTQFSNRVRITGNSISRTRIHGIQVWGKWNWDHKDSTDIVITGNHLVNSAGGAIWASGTRRVLVSNNIVDGADDVGIDLEWTEDATITGNIIRNFENAGISLFYSCKRISIIGNIINNDRVFNDHKQATWVRSGIWLTSTNTRAYKDDIGHSDVAITSNVISCDVGARRAMWIGFGGDNIVLGNNAVRGDICYSKSSPNLKPIVIKDNQVLKRKLK